MPVDPITVETTILISGEVQPSYGSILLIGENEGGVLGVNVVTRYTNIADVATDFLNTSKVYKAAVNVFAMGVTYLYAVKVDKASIGAESITAGVLATFAQHPVKGGTVVCATYTAQYVFAIPTDPGSLKMEIGTEGTQIFLNGTGSKSVAYDYYKIPELEAVIKDYERLVDIIVFCHYTQGTGGNGGFSSQDWGMFAHVVDLADTYAWITPVVGRGDQLAAVQLTDLKCGLMTSFTSRNVITLAHRNVTTTECMEGFLAARIALTLPWDKLMWKTFPGLSSDNITQFSKTEVATFEASFENALILKQSTWRMSDGLSMAGTGAYKYLDVTRSRYYLEENIMWDLERLIADVAVPFTESGILTVKGQIEQTLQKAVEQGCLKEPFVEDGVRKTGYMVVVPNYDDISEVDKAARLLDDIYATVYLTGRIEAITLNLSISV